MTLADRELLRRMGRGETLAQLAALDGRSTQQLEAWWHAECRRRVPAAEDVTQVAGARRELRIVRDRWGVPHISADDELDAFFGFGFATAQDRLFQLDYVRRKARGRLSEILGAEALESDKLYRTLDLSQVASAEWNHLPENVKQLVTAYSDGVQAAMAACGDQLPIEFDLLDYRPEPWTPLDCLAITAEFRWYLTGRFPVIAVPELVKRALGDGPRYEAFLLGEENDECILPRGSYPTQTNARPQPIGGGSPAPGPGSNNWVVAASRVVRQGPLLASDPHVPFQAVSIWHQVHVRGGRFNFAGIALAGMPGVLIGRNERLAWGVTNNICSQRDLYQEQTDATHQGAYRYGEAWETATVRRETIQVRDAAEVSYDVVSTRNGPLVDHLLPAPARHLGPVSLRWLGHQPCGWVTSVIGMNGANSVDEGREVTRTWLVPTFNVVFADVNGQIGYQCTGQLPVRRRVERAFRQGWNPDDAWQGTIPFDEMPRWNNPPSGAIVTANNRVADDDFAWPLSGTWVSGYRARRLRQTIEANAEMTRDDHRRLQLDVRSARAATCVPLLLAALDRQQLGAELAACEALALWDFFMRPSSAGAAVFHVFFTHWCRLVTARRLPPEQVELVSANAGGLAVCLLSDDPWQWFDADERIPAIREAFRRGVAELVERLGADITQWCWGRLHTIVQPHVLSGRGDLGRWLDRSGRPIGGDAHTINSSSPDARHAAWLGAGYRMLAELGDPQCGLWSVEISSVSGHPGSKHYDDQAETWHAGELIYSSLTAPPEGTTLRVTPK